MQLRTAMNKLNVVRDTKMKITLFIPTRNEIDGCKVMMPRIDPSWVDEIVCVDGNSTDGTAQYMRSLGIKVIDQQSSNLQGAYWECFDATSSDAIILFAPDGNMRPEIIPAMVELMRVGYDLVSVSRYLNGSTSEDDNALTAFGNWMFTKMVTILFGGNCTDLLYGYRAFRKDLIRRLALTRTELPVIEVEMMIRAIKEKIPFVELPGVEHKRIGGISKLRPFWNGLIVLWGIVKELFVPANEPKAILLQVGKSYLDANGIQWDSVYQRRYGGTVLCCHAWQTRWFCFDGRALRGEANLVQEAPPVAPRW